MGQWTDLHLSQCKLFFLLFYIYLVSGMTRTEKKELRMQVMEMFQHAYHSYMIYAYPADELMPLSCKGRYRASEPSRGDIDDTLGNFSLTLIDSLDTLVILGQLEEFEKAVKLVIRDVSFDSDVIVSVFETNIRVLGGLLSAHILAIYLRDKQGFMSWYKNELLEMAKDVGYHLLPAFNTSSGVPYPRINLKYGINGSSKISGQRETCTACAGTMILEFAALSRLTGEPIFEDKAHKAMEFLWKQRHRTSDLMGTVLNIHSGDWIRRDSGVGAGIDSYYEYCLKAYILLGNDIYLERFNKHYSAVMKYVSQGPLLVDVLMHRPHTTAKNFMDALLAFWPGLQVLKGDINPAIQTHEMLYQVIQRHTFLPEAFTVDFQVHWAQHPLRPEFVESTYFLYKATGDPYYLTVGKDVLKSLHDYTRVPCGFAALKDVRTGGHEDRMDSFVLAETLKYLYLLFAEKEDLVVDIDDYLFTTEAHLLPLTLGKINITNPNSFSDIFIFGSHKPNGSLLELADDINFEKSCPNTNYLFPGKKDYAHSVRQPLKNLVEELCPKTRSRRLRASDFIAGNQEQLEILNKMGIRLISLPDGRIQLLHSASQALTPEDAREGVIFMQEMLEYSKQQSQQEHYPRVVQVLSPLSLENTVLIAGPAQFGKELKGSSGVEGFVEIASPFRACSTIGNSPSIIGKIAIIERGDCMFIDKARRIQEAGGIGGIVIDNNKSTSTSGTAIFAMSSDGTNDVNIPFVFLFASEGNILLEAVQKHRIVKVLLAEKARTTTNIEGGKSPITTSQQVVNIENKSSNFGSQVKVQNEQDLIELAGSLQSDSGSKDDKNTFTISILNILKSLSMKQSSEDATSDNVDSDIIIKILKRKLQEEKDIVELQQYLEYIKAMRALLQLTVNKKTSSEEDTAVIQLDQLIELINQQMTNIQTSSLTNLPELTRRNNEEPSSTTLQINTSDDKKSESSDSLNHSHDNL